MHQEVQNLLNSTDATQGRMSEQVREMFSAIAPRYDLANEVLSLGIHHRWRRRAVEASGARSGLSVLDCATGTGDLALAFKRAVGRQGEVVGTDFCAEMLERAPSKAQSAGLEVRFEVADALALPYPNGRFDIASIAFGIRNVDDPVRCLAELARVVRPGGRVVVLEFGQPTGPFGALFRFYSRFLMPFIGGWLSGNRSAYRYLPRTAAAFPAGERFLELMDQAGVYSHRRAWPLTFGTAYVYVGEVR
jgi:demethylmenaquinone methyltransferase/2-methoxy-6-polyprenyl-1,4-benzoquinol methylase